MGNDGTTERGFNRIFEDLVKIALFMEQRVYNIISTVMRLTNLLHKLTITLIMNCPTQYYATLTGSHGENFGDANLVAGVEL